MKRELWQLDCWTRDIVLSLSFDAGELLELLQSQGLPVDERLDEEPAADVAVFGAVHRLCDCPGKFARRLGRILEARHAIAVARVRRAETDKVSSLCFRSPDVPGLLYAVCSDPRPEVRSLGPWLRYRALLEGMNALARTCRSRRFQSTDSRSRP